MYTHFAEQVKKLDVAVSSAKVILADTVWIAQWPPYLDEESHWGLDDECESRYRHS